MGVCCAILWPHHLYLVWRNADIAPDFCFAAERPEPAALAGPPAPYSVRGRSSPMPPTNLVRLQAAQRALRWGGQRGVAVPCVVFRFCRSQLCAVVT